jgi:hypothetical protein
MQKRILAPVGARPVFPIKMPPNNGFRGEGIRLSNLMRRYWSVIGPGSVGAKAGELMEATWAIRSAGFRLYPRVVLASGFFHSFIDRNRIREAIAKGACPDSCVLGE